MVKCLFVRVPNEQARIKALFFYISINRFYYYKLVMEMLVSFGRLVVIILTFCGIFHIGFVSSTFGSSSICTAPGRVSLCKLCGGALAQLSLAHSEHLQQNS